MTAMPAVRMSGINKRFGAVVALEGFDPLGPAVDDLYLTAIRTTDGWRIATDTDARPLGLSSTTHLWDLTPVVATELEFYLVEKSDDPVTNQVNAGCYVFRRRAEWAGPPAPGAPVAHTSPPCRWMIRCTMARPTPVPSNSSCSCSR